MVQVALAHVAAELLDLVELRLGLDAFSDDREVQRASERDDGGSDRSVGSVLQPGDEGSIDFDLVEREPAEIVQGGVPGSKSSTASATPSSWRASRSAATSSTRTGGLPFGDLHA